MSRENLRRFVTQTPVKTRKKENNYKLSIIYIYIYKSTHILKELKGENIDIRLIDDKRAYDMVPKFG